MTAIHSEPSDEPVYGIPPDWTCQAVVTPLAEQIDWSLRANGIPDLWKQNAGTAKGQPLVVCVCDTGVDLGHADLMGQVLDARDFTGSMFGADDQQGHGTWCTGMLVAQSGNDCGVSGVAHGGRALHAKVLGDNGSGSERSIIAGMKWGRSKGAQFFSLSLGGGPMSQAMLGLMRELTQEGCFIFCAAGNDGGDLNYPSFWTDFNVPVGASDKAGKLTKFSCRGPGLLKGVVGPGVDMLSTVPRRAGSFGLSTGTSMATPFCCAVGMLAYGKHQDHGGQTELNDVNEMREHLQRKAGKAGEYCLINPSEVLAGIEAKPAPKPPKAGIEIPLGKHFAIHAPAMAGDFVSLGGGTQAEQAAILAMLGLVE